MTTWRHLKANHDNVWASAGSLLLHALLVAALCSTPDLDLTIGPEARLDVLWLQPSSMPDAAPQPEGADEEERAASRSAAAATPPDSADGMAGAADREEGNGDASDELALYTNPLPRPAPRPTGRGAKKERPRRQQAPEAKAKRALPKAPAREPQFASRSAAPPAVAPPAPPSPPPPVSAKDKLQPAEKEELQPPLPLQAVQTAQPEPPLPPHPQLASNPPLQAVAAKLTLPPVTIEPRPAAKPAPLPKEAPQPPAAVSPPAAAIPRVSPAPKTPPKALPPATAKPSPAGPVKKVAPAPPANRLAAPGPAVRPAVKVAATSPAGKQQTREKPVEKPLETRGIVVTSIRGDMKMVMAANSGVKLHVAFREYPKSRRAKVQSRSEARHELKVVPIVAKGRKETTEAVIEKAGEGVYIFSAEPEKGEAVKASFTLKLFETAAREKVTAIGARTISGKTILTKVLMPEGIVWEDDSAFTGSLEDSDSVTKFNSQTGVYWKEYNE